MQALLGPFIRCRLGARNQHRWLDPCHFVFLAAASRARCQSWPPNDRPVASCGSPKPCHRTIRCRSRPQPALAREGRLGWELSARALASVKSLMLGERAKRMMQAIRTFEASHSQASTFEITQDPHLRGPHDVQPFDAFVKLSAHGKIHWIVHKNC